MTDPFWIAQRHGHDWVNHDMLELVQWMASHVSRSELDARLEAAQERFNRARAEIVFAPPGGLEPPADAVGWYLHQAQAYAQDRSNFLLTESFRIAPVFGRLASILSELKRVRGIEDRIHTMMAQPNAQPDTALFELLVAGAYAERGWQVAFVPEDRGGSRTPDLVVRKGRRVWAAECKRIVGQSYEVQEHAAAERLAQPVHVHAKAGNVWLSMYVSFKRELKDIPLNYLLEHVEKWSLQRSPYSWDDAFAEGCVQSGRPVRLHAALIHDAIAYRSSRMIELMEGAYRRDFDYSFDATWTPSSRNPFFADQVDRASVVAWRSGSSDAVFAKAKHLRSTVARAAGQLPSDVPGVVHVGYEARTNNSADWLRHRVNLTQLSTFKPEGSRLRWVYANYISPEPTTAKNESSAASETSAWFRIGRHATPDPLPGHLLLDSKDGVPGDHWNR